MAKRKPTGAGIHTSSASDEWLTPASIAEVLNQLGVALDPCSGVGQHVRADVEVDVSEGVSGLEVSWHLAEGLVYVNPPYSELYDWLAKCAIEAANGAEILALVPAWTETRAFHECVFPHVNYVLAIEGRVVYEQVREDGTVGPKLDARGKPVGSTFSSWLVYYGGRGDVLRAFASFGRWIDLSPEGLS